MATNGALMAAQEFTFEFELEGKKIKVRRAMGRDLRLAQMAAGNKRDGFSISLALIAQTCLFNGKKIPFEAIESWWLTDIEELILQAMPHIRPTKPALQLREEPEEQQELSLNQAE